VYDNYFPRNILFYFGYLSSGNPILTLYPVIAVLWLTLKKGLRFSKGPYNDSFYMYLKAVAILSFLNSKTPFDVPIRRTEEVNRSRNTE
jgi:hypothetical protein